jgi:hypothetical protein
MRSFFHPSNQTNDKDSYDLQSISKKCTKQIKIEANKQQTLSSCKFLNVYIRLEKRTNKLFDRMKILNWSYDKFRIGSKITAVVLPNL